MPRGIFPDGAGGGSVLVFESIGIREVFVVHSGSQGFQGVVIPVCIGIGKGSRVGRMFEVLLLLRIIIILQILSLPLLL